MSSSKLCNFPAAQTFSSEEHIGLIVDGHNYSYKVEQRQPTRYCCILCTTKTAWVLRLWRGFGLARSLLVCYAPDTYRCNPVGRFLVVVTLTSSLALLSSWGYCKDSGQVFPSEFSQCHAIQPLNHPSASPSSLSSFPHAQSGIEASKQAPLAMPKQPASKVLIKW